MASADESPLPAARTSQASGVGDRSIDLGVPFSMAGARTMLGWLIMIELGLAVLHVVLQYTDPFIPWGPIERLFNLNEEISVPTWFSAVQLFGIGAVLMLAAANNRQASWLPNWLLLAGAGVFVFLSADEGAMIHERITSALKRLGEDRLLFGGERGGWIVPYLVIAVLGLLMVARPLSKVVTRYPRESLVAAGGATLMVIGAVGLEIVSYYFVPERSGGMGFELAVAAEEFLEMAGASIILYAALVLASRISTPETTGGASSGASKDVHAARSR